MNVSLKSANIVVIAKNHNPSIISKEWLSQNKIIEEKVINFVHTPVFSVIETDNFNLIVDPDRLQVSVKKINSENINKLLEIVEKYTNQLPETPYTTLGFNYIYNVTSDKKNLKDLFSKNDKLFRSIFTEDYQIGGLINFDYGNFLVRAKLTQVNEGLTVDFNFHLELKTPTNIKEGLQHYFDLKKKAEKILGELF